MIKQNMFNCLDSYIIHLVNEFKVLLQRIFSRYDWINQIEFQLELNGVDPHKERKPQVYIHLLYYVSHDNIS